LRHMSPLLFVALRMALCSVLLILLMFVLRKPWQVLSGWVWVHCAIAGVLLTESC